MPRKPLATASTEMSARGRRERAKQVCSQKVNYATQADAQRQARFWRGQEPYRCAYCGDWHLTTRK